MNIKKHKRSLLKINIEVFLAIIIAILMIVLINITNSKLEEVLEDRHLLIARENPEDSFNERFGDEIIKYIRNQTCTMVETYDTSYMLISRLCFTMEDNCMYGSIGDIPGLIDIFNSYQEGHTTVHIDNIEEDIYFRWIEDRDGTKQLMVLYSMTNQIYNLWYIPFLCYLILILIFVLVIRLRFLQEKDTIKYYYKIR